MHFRKATTMLLGVGLVGCVVSAKEVERRQFSCGGLNVSVSTVQRVSDAFGGEEFVFATVEAGGKGARFQLDQNGRWTDRLGLNVSEDREWVRFHLTQERPPLETVTQRDVDGDGELDFLSERPGPSPRSYPYVYVAYIHLPTRTLVRHDHEHSTKEEREGGWFTSTTTLAAQQLLRGHSVTWHTCS